MESTQKFTLPPLPYAQNALEKKGLNERTISIHYGKHHQGYVNKLNAFTEGNPAQRAKSLEELVKTEPAGKVKNCAGQILNHTLFWNSMSPNGGGEPTGAIKAKIDKQFGSFAEFKATFTGRAASHFGSGWVFLCVDSKGELCICDKHDAGTPIEDGKTPLLCIDVWEHAYYLQFENKRGDFISTWWGLVNWDFVNAGLTA